MKKTQLQLIEIIEKHLPQDQQFSNINALITGEDAILAGTNEINGEKVEKEKEYIVGNTLVMPVDHKGRMKRALKRNGKNGLIQYCKKYLKKNDTRNLEEAINIVF